MLVQHTWPGNVRELDNVIQRAVLLAGRGEVLPEHILFESTQVPVVPPLEVDEDSLGGDLKDFEQRLILGALEEGGGSRKFAAEKLGISPRTLRYKLARMRDAGMAIPGR